MIFTVMYCNYKRRLDPRTKALNFKQTTSQLGKEEMVIFGCKIQICLTIQMLEKNVIKEKYELK